jgi:hypothetical protein
MTNLEKLKSPALEIGGGNYIVWSLELMNNLCAECISETADENFALPTGTTARDVTVRKDAARAVCMILRHLHQDLKFNYLEERNPVVRLRFDTDRKQAMLPLFNDEWNKLCFYNFKAVTCYGSDQSELFVDNVPGLSFDRLFREYSVWVGTAASTQRPIIEIKP